VATWTAEQPRFRLFDGPSPLQPLPRFAAALGGRADVWIKREDLLPIGFGGNKLRNLEFLLGEALAEGADTVVTSGRRWSNHCRLTAAAGAMAGLEVHVVVTGPPVDPPTANLRLDELFGAIVHQAATGDRSAREALVRQVTADLRAAGRRPVVVDVGGSGVVGAVGQVLAGLEVVDQAATAGIVIDALVVPSATGGTQAGLLVGLRTGGAATLVHGIAVTPADELRPRIDTLVAELATVPGLARVEAREIRLDEAQLGAGYGRPTAAAGEATRLLARSEGILVDPIYTAKALAGLVARVRDGTFDGRRVVFWHAGGTPGLFEPLESA